MEPKLLRVKAAGDLIGYRETKVRELAKRGLLDAVKIDGGEIRITAESIERFVEQAKAGELA